MIAKSIDLTSALLSIDIFWTLIFNFWNKPLYLVPYFFLSTQKESFFVVFNTQLQVHWYTLLHALTIHWPCYIFSSCCQCVFYFFFFAQVIYFQCNLPYEQRAAEKGSKEKCLMFDRVKWKWRMFAFQQVLQTNFSNTWHFG